MALDMRNVVFFQANFVGEELNSQVPSNAAMGFPQGWAANRSIAHWRHENFGCAPVICTVELKISPPGPAAEYRIEKLGLHNLD